MARKDDLNYAHSEDGGDVGLESAPHERSATAKEIADLQDKILKFARNRERLPQPLFWSLFNSRIREIKKNKELERLLNDMLG